MDGNSPVGGGRLLKGMAVSLTCLLSWACASSPPVRYLILDPVGLQGEVWKRSGAPVHIAGVHVPQALDRREVVREEAPNLLTVSKEYRWAAPLPDMMQRVLSQDLMVRLTSGQVLVPGQPAPAGAGAISVEVLEFGVDMGGGVVLSGSWSIIDGDSAAPLASYPFQLHQSAPGSDFAGQARAMSVLLGQLADSIAGNLGTRKAE